jgi:hypothetical protein
VNLRPTAALTLLLIVSAGSVAAAQPAPAADRPPAGADQARDVVREILATPEFAGAAGPSAVDRLAAAAADWLIDLLRRLGLDGGAGVEIARGLAWMVAALAVAGLALLLVHTWRRRGAHAAAGPTAGSREVSRPSAEWVARVAQALDTGELREAVRCAYLAAVVRLEEQGVWRVDEARTPREYLRLVPPDDRRKQPFGDLTREFERSWYGAQPADTRGLWRWLEECGCPPRNPAT